MITPTEHDALAIAPADLGKCLFCRTPLRWQTDDIDGWIAHLYCVGCDFLGPMSDFKYQDVEDAKADSWNRWVKGIASTPSDVVALVLAGRAIMDGGYVSTSIEDERGDAEALHKALEAFSSRVCYDDEGGELPEAHADPCTCGLQNGEGG